MRFLKKINTFTSEGERPHPDESLEKYGTSCFESLDPDAIILFSDVDEIVFSQHLLILKNVDFPINTFVHFEMPLSYYYFHWNAISCAFSNAKIFLRSYLDAYYGNNILFDSDPYWNLPNSGYHCSYCFSMPVDDII